MSAFILTVRQPFSGYKRGDLITDKATVKQILAGNHKHDVVKSFPKPEHVSGAFFQRTPAQAKA